MKKTAKTKKKQQAWWNGLDANGQKDYIGRLKERKAQMRRDRSIEIMAGKEAKDCAACFHRKTGSCTDDLQRGCEYWRAIG